LSRFKKEAFRLIKENENEKYNPFNDSSLHSTHKEDMIPIDAREGFNDALKHYDGVNGFQSTKSLSELPYSYRRILRFCAFAGVGGFALVILFTLFNNITGLIK
jgi:hypothetical protein